jgi:ATP-dependent Clp protease ATP-binding subunit ClpA
MTRSHMTLDANRSGHVSKELERHLSARVVGQERAVGCLCRMYEAFVAGIHTPRRPVGAVLFLGPTGSGKTHIAEAMAEVLFGRSEALVRINCGDDRHPHDMLAGAPAGLSLVLFDEIEKASDALWQQMLGVLDTGARRIVMLTSNIAAREMTQILTRGIGFADARDAVTADDPGVLRRMDRAARSAATNRFSPEFLSRIDQTIVFRPLAEDQLRQILAIELGAIQSRILTTRARGFRFECSEAAKDVLLKKGTDVRYGARHLKRAVEGLLVGPLSTLLSTGQVARGDVVSIDADNGALTFSKMANDVWLPHVSAGADAAMARLTASMHRVRLL